MAMFRWRFLKNERASEFLWCSTVGLSLVFLNFLSDHTSDVLRITSPSPFSKLVGQSGEKAARSHCKIPVNIEREKLLSPRFFFSFPPLFTTRTPRSTI